MTAASSAGSPALSDHDAVRALLGRESITHHAVAVRCPHGRPAVLQNAPTDADGNPFPTRYWLACRALGRAVSRLEADGGVKALERDAEMSDAVADAHRRHAELHDGHRVAGSGDPRHVKCLHAHLAFALAEGGAIERWIGDRVAIDWPKTCCVDDILGGRDE